MLLVLGDGLVSHNLLTRLLNEAGFTWQSARAILPDSSTLDALKPALDGWATLARREREPELAAIPVVLLTLSRLAS